MQPTLRDRPSTCSEVVHWNRLFHERPASWVAAMVDPLYGPNASNPSVGEMNTYTPKSPGYEPTTCQFVPSVVRSRLPAWRAQPWVASRKCRSLISGSLDLGSPSCRFQCRPPSTVCRIIPPEPLPAIHPTWSFTNKTSLKLRSSG